MKIMNILPHENYPLYGITTWIETNLVCAPVARARDAVAAGQLLHDPERSHGPGVLRQS